MCCQCTDAKCSERQKLYARRPCTARAAPSTIPGAGQGLFSDRPYKAHEFVTFYSGTVLKNSALEGDRVLSIDACWNIDGAGSCRHPQARGDLVNHSDDAVQLNCCFSRHNRALRTVCIKTIRTVPQHAEFFINYGPEFQF